MSELAIGAIRAKTSQVIGAGCFLDMLCAALGPMLAEPPGEPDARLGFLLVGDVAECALGVGTLGICLAEELAGGHLGHVVLMEVFTDGAFLAPPLEPMLAECGEWFIARVMAVRATRAPLAIPRVKCTHCSSLFVGRWNESPNFIVLNQIFLEIKFNPQINLIL